MNPLKWKPNISATAALADRRELAHVAVAEGPRFPPVEDAKDVVAKEGSLSEGELGRRRRGLDRSAVIPGDHGAVARGPELRMPGDAHGGLSGHPSLGSIDPQLFAEVQDDWIRCVPDRRHDRIGVDPGTIGQDHALRCHGGHSCVEPHLHPALYKNPARIGTQFRPDFRKKLPSSVDQYNPGL